MTGGKSRPMPEPTEADLAVLNRAIEKVLDPEAHPRTRWSEPYMPIGLIARNAVTDNA